MSKVDAILQEIMNQSHCKINKAEKSHDFLNFEKREGVKLPKEIKEFYTKTDGVELFKDAPYSYRILRFSEISRANPLIVGEECADDISYFWYVIAKESNGDYITIDLSAERTGLCYDSSHEVHGVVGECSIVARSFTEMLHELVKSRGENIFWLEESWDAIGDAYDN